MKRKPSPKSGMSPSVVELRLRSDLEVARAEIQKLRKQVAGKNGEPENGDAPVNAAEEAAALAAAAAEPVVPPVSLDPAALVKQVEELSRTRQRLSKLYFNQVEENRKRATKLHLILENIHRINSERDLDTLLSR